MEPRLIPFNGWIALMTGDGGWPSPLGDAGFRLAGLEWPVTTSEGAVVIDGLGIDDARLILLASECKSGQNVEPRQARAYGAIAVADVARQMTAASSARTVQAVYVCLEGAEERIQTGLDSVGSKAPVIVIGTDHARVQDRAGGSSIGAWRVSVPVGPPPRLVPVDADSPKSELREFLLPAIIAAARRNLSVVPVNSLLDSALPYWALLGRNARERIRKKAVAAIRDLATTEFKDFFRVEKGGPEIDREVVKILKSPSKFDARGETQGWQALQRKGQRALRGEKPTKTPGQISLEDLGLSISGDEP